jgi:MFS family permease
MPSRRTPSTRRPRPRVQPRVSRLLVSHALAATAMSLPWPWLLVLVWHGSHSAGLLGLAAAARMLPYVACSWWAGRIGDRYRRDVVVRTTVALRLGLLAAVPLAVLLDSTALAVVLAAAAVAVATPAYPALAAALPDAAPDDSERATELLVTIEVASFVVGPAVGGLLLGFPAVIALLAVAASAASLALLAGIRLPRPVRRTTEHGGAWRALGRSRPLRRAMGLMALLNLVDAAAGVTLILLARGGWTGSWSPDTAYGVASAALGFGALLAPALVRCGSGLVGRSGWGLVLMAAGVVGAAVTPAVTWAIAPLLLAGAAAVHAESAATGVVQEQAPDGVRASLFGVADSCMVGAALVGALLAPGLAQSVGPRPLLVGLGVLAAASMLVLPGLRPTGPQVVPSTATPPTSSSVSTEAASPMEVSSRAV